MINVGIIGAGRMGERHADAYRQIPYAKVIGFADIDEKKAKKLAKKFNVKSFTVKEILQNEIIDAVNICTQNPYHAKNTAESLW